MAMLATLTFAAVGVQAMTVSYQCTGRRLLTAELTPRAGQIHFEGQDWTLARVRAGHDAHYVNAKAGIDVVTKERQMTFTHGTETLQCFLYSDALPGDAPRKTN
jgi:membrane-bound inhibitor of C-type lysozyme